MYVRSIHPWSHRVLSCMRPSPFRRVKRADLPSFVDVDVDVERARDHVVLAAASLLGLLFVMANDDDFGN